MSEEERPKGYTYKGSREDRGEIRHNAPETQRGTPVNPRHPEKKGAP